MVRERLITEEDRAQLSQEIAKDETHKSWMTDSFFFEPNTVSFVYEDEKGPIMYARLCNALRVHIQFCDVPNKWRIMDALITQFPSVVERAQRNGFRQIVFDSVSKRLIAFCVKYLKFVPSSDDYVKWL